MIYTFVNSVLIWFKSGELYIYIIFVISHRFAVQEVVSNIIGNAEQQKLG